MIQMLSGWLVPTQPCRWMTKRVLASRYRIEWHGNKVVAICHCSGTNGPHEGVIPRAVESGLRRRRSGTV